MYFIKKLLFSIILSIFLSIQTSAQTPKAIYHHNMFWGRIVLADQLSPKLKWEFYLQQRTQNDPDHKWNIFRHHQLSSYWLWFHYQPFKDLRVSISPFCYFNTIALYPQPEIDGDRGVKEYRWAASIEHTNKLKHFQFANRYGVEYRYRDLYEENHFVGNYRIRYRAKLEKPLKKEGRQFNLIVYDEIFLEFGKALKASPAIFNQNRLYAGFSYELLKNVKFNLGYMYVLQERSSGKAVDNSNVIWGILTFDNLFSQFIKKKAPLEEIKKQ
jgi:hypothetical protein